MVDAGANRIGASASVKIMEELRIEGNEEQFAILERIPYRETDFSCLYWESISERSFLRLGQVEKFLTGGKVLFGREHTLGRILRVKNHHVLTGVITEKYVPYEKYSPFMIWL